MLFKGAGFFLCALVASSLCSCAKSHSPVDSYPESAQPGTRAELLSVQDRLSTSPPTDTSAALEILPKIHRAFTLDRALRIVEIHGYRFAQLARIPRRALERISLTTFPDSHHSGLAVLQASFWKKVAEKQREGVRIGFILKAPQDLLVYGVSFHQPDFIGLSVFANEGTLDHELRHLEQYRSLDPFRSRSAKTLSASCLDHADVFFRELDATDIQLPFWEGVSWDFEQRVSDSLEFDLHYPGQVAQDVIFDPSCPAELVKAAEDIQLLVSSEKGAIEKPLQDKNLADLDKEIQLSADERVPQIRKILSVLSAPVRDDLCHFAGGFAFLSDCP